MPVTPKYTWRETDDEVVVDVALRGALVRKPDITLATAFLKLSSPPYLLAIDLYGEVDSERARAELNADGLQLHLPKREAGLWGQLVLKGDKAALRRRRIECLQESEAASSAAEDSHRSALEELSRKVGEQQQSRHTTEYQAREARKAQQLAEEQQQLATWQEGLAHASDSDSEDQDALPVEHPAYYGRGWHPSAKEAPSNGDAHLAPTTPPQEEVDPAASAPPASRERVQPANAANLPKPAPARYTVQVSFTPLETPHLPAREARGVELKASKQEREQLQLQSNAPLSEQHPVMLKDKGLRMLAAGNYQGALHAFSSALEVDGGLVDALAGRAECYVHLEQLMEGLQDCEAAISVLQARQQDESQQLSEAESQQLTRLVAMREEAQACIVKDDDDAQDRIPESEGPVHEHTHTAAGSKHKQNVDADAETTKQQSSKPPISRAHADALLRTKEYAQAIDTYTRLIATSSTGDDKELIALHSNRAAARIAAGCFEEACSDCTAAIARLLGTSTQVQSVAKWIAALESDDRDAEENAAPQLQHSQAMSLMRSLARRGLASARMGRGQAAHQDYVHAATACRALGLHEQAGALDKDAASVLQGSQGGARSKRLTT